jgi:hypothetical protein
MASNQRLAQAKKHNLCFNCLKGGHTTENCIWATCNICNEKHNTLLHTQQKSTAPLIQSEDIVVNNFCKTRDISGLLSTAIAIYTTNIILINHILASYCWTEVHNAVLLKQVFLKN